MMIKDGTEQWITIVDDSGGCRVDWAHAID